VTGDFLAAAKYDQRRNASDTESQCPHTT
jgi:hypothetical protein